MGTPAPPSGIAAASDPGAGASASGEPGSGAAAAAAAKPAGKSRIYPDEPRVGVGVVCFRAPSSSGDPEVLLVKRAKEPAMGLWCFPGGSLELGESLAQCAVREVLEEAAVELRCDDVAAPAAAAAAPAAAASGGPAGGGAGGGGGESGGGGGDSEGFSKSLWRPTAFAAVDSIVSEEGGRIRFHYVVVEVAAVARDPGAMPVAGDDVSDAVWMRVSQLAGLGDTLVANCERLAREAVERFTLER